MAESLRRLWLWGRKMVFPPDLRYPSAMREDGQPTIHKSFGWNGKVALASQFRGASRAKLLSFVPSSKRLWNSFLRWVDRPALFKLSWSEILVVSSALLHRTPSLTQAHIFFGFKVSHSSWDDVPVSFVSSLFPKLGVWDEKNLGFSTRDRVYKLGRRLDDDWRHSKLRIKYSFCN